MTKWHLHTIGDLVREKIIAEPMDGNHGEIHPKGNDFTKIGIPFVMASDIKNGLIDFDRCKYISKYQADKLRKGFSQVGDVLLSHKATIGRTAIVPKSDFPYLMLTPQVTYYRVLDSDKLNNKFLKYYFDSPLFQRILKLRAGAGSTRAYLGIIAQKDLPISIPDIKLQKQLVDVLSVIDEKIELNNQINSELEAMINLIYDYWFVQFDFPDESGKPYKSSGGKMIYNEVLKREIPEGWNDISLGNIILKSGTGLNPRRNFKLGEGENFYITIKNIKNGRIIFDDNTDRISDKSLEIINQRSDLQIGDILFTSIDPVGVTYFIHEKPKNWNINESVFTLRADKKLLTPEFLFMLLSSKEMKVFTKQSSAGSIHKGIRHEVLKDFKLPYGGMPVILSFTKILRPLLERQHILYTETQKLNELRDWLLPMLMNGQVIVGEAS